jgi:hypothetical protein
MFEFLFDLPLAITGPVIVGSLCLFAIGGLFLVRRRVPPRLRVHVQDSEFTGALVQCVMVFYGLRVALIAVSVFQTYSDVSKIVSQEATAVASLYRGVIVMLSRFAPSSNRDFVIIWITSSVKRGAFAATGTGHMGRDG